MLTMFSPNLNSMFQDLMCSYYKSISIDMKNGFFNLKHTLQFHTKFVLDFTSVSFLSKIEDENITNLKWLGTSTTKTTLAGIEKSAGTGQFLYSGGQVGELPFNVSANMPVDKLILGDFSQVLLGVWSEIDILVNPYAEPAYSRGGIQVRAMATCDVAVRHPKAFLVAGA